MKYLISFCLVLMFSQGLLAGGATATSTYPVPEQVRHAQTLSPQVNSRRPLKKKRKFRPKDWFQKNLGHYLRLGKHISLALFGISTLASLVAVLGVGWSFLLPFVLVISGLSALNMVSSLVLGFWGLIKTKPDKEKKKAMHKDMRQTVLLFLATLIVPYIGLWMTILIEGPL